MSQLASLPFSPLPLAVVCPPGFFHTSAVALSVHHLNLNAKIKTLLEYMLGLAHSRTHTHSFGCIFIFIYVYVNSPARHL